MSFQANYRGIGDMLCAPWMVTAMHARAELVAAEAKARAPRRSGRYAASITVSAGVREGRSRRAFGRVASDVPYALAVEYGTEDTKAHRTLRTALEAAKG